MKSSKTINMRTILLLFSIMVIIGFVGNLRGALLPSIKKDLSISYSDIGLMIFVTSLGYFSSTFFGGIIGDRIGQRKVLAFGFAVITIGLIGILFTKSFFILLITMLILNTGLGCFDIGLNSLASRVFVTNTAIMMSMMHVFFGLGSSASPKIAGFMLSKNIEWNYIYFSAIALIGTVFVLYATTPIKYVSSQGKTPRIPLSTLFKDKRLWLFIGVLGFCEATEGGIGTWLINFLQIERGLSKSESTQYMFYFFLIYTVGRIFGGYLAEKLGYIRTIISFVIITIVLFVSGLFLGNSWAILFSLTGFSISIMYPTMVTVISKEFTEGISSALGIIMTAAGLMSVGSSLLIGKINDSIGVSAGIAMIPVFASVAVVLLFILRGFLRPPIEKIAVKSADVF